MNRRASVGRALDGDPAAESLYAILEADEARPAREVGAADAVVLDGDAKDAVHGLDLDGDGQGARMLRRVRQRLRDDVVRADLDLLGQPPLRTDVQRDWDSGAACQRLQRRTEPAPCQNRRVDPARHLAHLVKHVRDPGGDVLELRPELAELRWYIRLSPPQLEPERDEPLLGSVVQVALDPAPRLVGGGDDARSRRPQLGLALGVGDRGGDELRKSAQARLRSRRRRLVAGRRDDDHPPRPSLDGDRRANGGADPENGRSRADVAGGVGVLVYPCRTAGLAHALGDGGAFIDATPESDRHGIAGRAPRGGDRNGVLRVVTS